MDDDRERTLTAGAGAAALRAQLAAARRRAEHLRRVIELISGELELEALLTRIIESAAELTGASYGAIGLVIEGVDGPRVRTAALVNLPPDGIGAELGPGEGMLGSILSARRPVRIARYADLPQMSVTGLDENAVIGVPIWWAQRLLGALSVGAPPPHRFSDDDEELLTALARHASVAVENARLYGETRRALETTRLLYDVSRRLAGAMTVEEVVRAYLEEVAARGHYVCTVALYDSDLLEQRTTVIVQGNWSPGEGLRLKHSRFPYSRDALDGPLDTGETIAMRDVHSDPRCTPVLRAIQAESGRPALAVIPLLARGRRIGSVFLSYGRRHDWPPEDLRLYQTTAAQLASALDSRLQHSLLAERSRELAVFEERRRLARELHDSVTQSLFSLSLLAQVLPELWELDRPEAEQSLEQVRDLTRGALAEMRELLYELRPTEGGDHDLVQALRTCAGAFARRSGLHMKLDGPTSLRLPADVVHALMRITQEALTNIDHHARAEQVRLELSAGPPIVLRISDNGRGFDPAGVPVGRLGLVSMRERAEAIGAVLTLSSAPGQGAELTISWPAS